MRKKIFLIPMLILALFIAGCASGSSPSIPESLPTAVEYADFGKTLNDAIPSGLKAGVANADLSAALIKELSGDCALNYTDCPYITASGGGDSNASEILSKLWAIDYHDECEDAMIADGTCFMCEDCSDEHPNFIKPTMLSDPTACATTPPDEGRYVNFGIDPCFFDTAIAEIPNIAECKTSTGREVNISTVVPWFASWGIPETVTFSAYSAHSSNGGMWWTVNAGASLNQQHFVSLDSNWFLAGIKDPDNDEFMFFGTGSSDYYESLGEGSGVNVSAYAGTLSAIPEEFEVIQIRDQFPNASIIRLKSNGEYIWYQNWHGDDFPATPAEVQDIKNSPTDNRCLEIGSSVVTSKYVPLQDCVDSFGKASITELNLDNNFILKVVDGQTVGSIDFSASLTSDTESSCLTEETESEGLQ